MGKDKRPAALSVSDAALARQTARLVGEQMRLVLWEDRQIRSGYHRELDYTEVSVEE